MASRTGPYQVTTSGGLSGGSTASATVALRASVSQGDTVLLGVVTNAVIPWPATPVTDSQGNQWGLVYSDTNQTTAMLYVFEADNCNALAAGIDTLTINYGGATDPVVHDWVAIGLPGTVAVGVVSVDQIAVPADGNSGTATSNAVTPLLPGETAIAFVANGNQAVTWGSGFGFIASANDGVHSRISAATLALQSQAPVTATATFSSTPWAIALFTIPASVQLTQDSLVINDQIELLNGGQFSTLPQCSGTKFLLVPGYDLSAPQPTTDYVGSLLLDGERPFGRRSSNRVIKLSVQIRAPNFIQLAAAREALMMAVDQETWSLRWTRRAEPVTGDPDFAGNLNLPLIFDCFRAQPTVVMWGGYDKFNRNPVGQVDLTFDALPYGRSDIPVITTFQSPIVGQVAPPAAVTIDNYTDVVGTHIFANVDGTFESGVSTWTNLTSCTFAASSAQAYNGNGSALMTVTGSPAAAWATPGLANAVPVIGGKQYRVMARALSVAGYSGGVCVGVQWYRDDQILLSTATASTVNLPANTWTAVLGTFTAPPNAAFALYQLQISGSPSTGTAVFWDDAFMVRNLWSQSALGPGPFSARWATAGITGLFVDSGQAKAVTYSRSGLTSMNLTGLTGLTLWLGLGSTGFYPWWGLKLAGQVQLTITLTDAAGNTAAWSHSRRVRMSNNSVAPAWQKIRLPIPQSGAFNPAQVTGYSITVSSRPEGDLRFTDVYLSLLTAQPVTSQGSPAPSTGWVYDMAGIVGSARAPVSLQIAQPAGATSTVVKTYQTAGSFLWLCPAGVTSVKVECTGAGSGGPSGVAAGGGGGAGGEYAAEATVAVTAGQAYSYTVGKGGTGGNLSAPNGTAGGNSSFAGNAVTVTAHGGSAGSGATGGTGGTGSTNTTHHNGGNGGTGGTASGGNATGGGGGGSGGSAAAGNNGTAGNSGGAGAAAVTGGGAGGAGGFGASPIIVADAGGKPGGGGGGGGDSVGGAAGGNGQVKLTYTETLTFKTLVVHRPNPNAPDTFCPYVSVPTTDVPNGTTEYQVPSLVPGLNATFGSTYTVVLVNSAWNSPSSSRTLTVTANQYEQAGGTKYSASVSLAGVIPNNLAGPLVVLGELTLPLSALPEDNLDGFFTFTVTDTNTSDDFQEILFLDTMGQTILIQSPNAYVTYWIDEPRPDRDLGNVMASVFLRADAVSALSWAAIAGPPMYADPLPGTNQYLLVYAQEGAPAVQMTYWPRWMFDRVA